MIRNTAGIVLIAVGALGLLVPVIPGIPLVASGILILGANHPLVRSSHAVVRKLRDWRRNL